MSANTSTLEDFAEPAHQARGWLARTRFPEAEALWRIAPLVVLAYSLLLPQEMRLNIAGQTIYPYRGAVILLTPWVLYQLVTGHLRLVLADLVVLIGSIWIVVSMMANYGSGQGFVRGGAIALDVLAPFFVARLCISSLTDFRRFLVLFAPGAFLAGASILLESVARTAIVRPAAAAIFGPLPLYQDGKMVGESEILTSFRFGMLRAAGPFSHSILAGLFLSSLIPLYFLSGVRKWPKKVGLASGLLCVLSISSAAFLGLLMSFAMIGYDWLQRRTEFLSWKLLAFAGVMFALFLHFLSDSGLIDALVRLTLNPQTGYYRLIIWEYGLASIQENPLFGIGYSGYERPIWLNSSIDAHWLLLGVRHGLVPVVALFGLSLFVVGSIATACTRTRDLERGTLAGIAMSLVIMIVLGFTVSFFGGVLIWFFALLGAGLSVSMRH